MNYGKKDKKPVAGFGDIAGLPGGVFEPSTSDGMALLEKMIGTAPMGSSEQDRARRIAREMESRTLMRLTKDVPKMSFKFVEKVAKDPFGLAAENAASELFGLKSKPTEFQSITGPLGEDF